MAQEEFDPLDLMSRVAMLILEARTPHQSAKGRMEGPHCPGGSQQQGQHRCSQESFECLRASEFRQRLNHMWRNGIPSCIDVVLYPDCQHGWREALSLEMTGASALEDDFGPCLQENCLLLEHWNIQCTKKWHGEWTQGVAGSMLLQAIRSYLYFSQLSSWLASMNGCIPNCIACRLYAPGEEGAVEFTQHPQSHVFPSAVYGPHGVKVSVLSLPRQLTFPIVLCVLSPQGEWAAGNGGDVDKVTRRGGSVCDDDDDEWSGHRTHTKLTGLRSDKVAKLAAPRSSPTGFKCPAPDKALRARPPDTARTHQGQRKAGGTCTSPTAPPKVRVECHGGQVEERKPKAERSSAREVLEGQLRPLELTSPTALPRVDLHSPKVLVSEGIHPAPLVTRKKRLDLSGVGGAPQLDDLQWLMKPSPMSPLDMHQFLTNLHALAAPIPSHHATPFPSQSTLAAYHCLKAVDDDAPASAVVVPLPGPERQDLAGLSSPADQHTARFRKKKALPYGGDTPESPRALESLVPPCQSSAFVGRNVLSSPLSRKSLPFCSSSMSVDSTMVVCNAREAPSQVEAKSRDADSSSSVDRRPTAEETSTEVRSEKKDRASSSKSQTSTEPSADKDSPSALFQHSTQQQTLSDSISQTLRDLSKIVWASEAKPALNPSLSLWSSTAAEAVPASSASTSSLLSSSSSSSSSTYSSSPVVSSEGGTGHSDANSTPTNRSCSPLAEDDHSNQSSSPPLDQRQQSSCTPSSLSTSATSIGNTETPVTRIECADGLAFLPPAFPTLQEGSAVTPPDSSTKAFKATSVKRRLELVDPGSKQSHQAADSTEGADADRVVAKVLVADETGSSGISVMQQVAVEGSKEYAGHKGCVAEEPSHVSDAHCSQHSSLGYQTSPSSKPSPPAQFPDQLTEACDDVHDDGGDDDDTHCMFYLESPSSPEPPSRGTTLPEGRQSKVKNEAWLISSFSALQVNSEQSSSSGESQLHGSAGENQPVTNGCVAVDVSRNLPDYVTSIGKDTSEDVVISGEVLGKAARANLSQIADSDVAGKLLSSQSSSRAVSDFRKDLARPDSFANCSWDVKRDSEPADDGKPSFTPDFSPIVSNHGDDATHPLPPPPSSAKSATAPSSTRSSLASSIAKSALASSLAKASQEKFSHKPSGPTPHCYDSNVDIHAPYLSHSCQVFSGSISPQPASPPSSPTKLTELEDVSPSSSPDCVFFDAATDSKASDSGPCPMRTKSAPSFAALSASKSGLAVEDKSSEEEVPRGRSVFKDKDGKLASQERLRSRLVKSASLMFSSRGSLPSQSSPAPVKRRSTGRFDYDETLTTTKAIKSAISLSRLTDVSKETSAPFSGTGRVLSTSAPASTNCLLGNFEESILNGRLEPAGVVDGFSVEIGASGSFCPRHLSLPVTAYFFNLSDDNAPSPYLGHINLEGAGKRGYRIPNKGTLQVTLFNPNRTVVKMFVVRYDLEDMPPNCQTIIRQRTVYVPSDPASDLPSYLRYLIHLRVISSSGGKVYLHTDVRLIFARNKFELDSTVAEYELRSFTETPVNPKYSPKR